MVKYICDNCSKDIEQGKSVRIEYKVTHGSRNVDSNFMPGMLTMGKDLCPVCAKKFISQSEIDRVIVQTKERKDRFANKEEA